MLIADCFSHFFFVAVVVTFACGIVTRWTVFYGLIYLFVCMHFFFIFFYQVFLLLQNVIADVTIACKLFPCQIHIFAQLLEKDIKMFGVFFVCVCVIRFMRKMLPNQNYLAFQPQEIFCSNPNKKKKTRIKQIHRGNEFKRYSV